VPGRTANRGDSRSLTDNETHHLTCIYAAQRIHPKPSKLVLRVRFPSSALIDSSW
jgi:hypothetical protein